MTVTRDPEFPVEIAQLMNAFNVCADGHNAQTVLNASIQMVIASIGYHAKTAGVSFERAEAYALNVGDLILSGVRENWNRQAKPTDVAVRRS